MTNARLLVTRTDSKHFQAATRPTYQARLPSLTGKCTRSSIGIVIEEAIEAWQKENKNICVTPNAAGDLTFLNSAVAVGTIPRKIVI